MSYLNMVINNLSLRPHEDIFTHELMMEVFVEQPQQVFSNCIIGSKVTAILLDVRILPICGVASGMVCEFNGTTPSS